MRATNSHGAEAPKQSFTGSSAREVRATREALPPIQLKLAMGESIERVYRMDNGHARDITHLFTATAPETPAEGFADVQRQVREGTARNISSRVVRVLAVVAGVFFTFFVVVRVILPAVLL